MLCMIGKKSGGGLPKIAYANLIPEIINDKPIEFNKTESNYNYVIFEMNIKKGEIVNIEFKIKEKVGNFEGIDIKLSKKINGNWYKNDDDVAYNLESGVNVSIPATDDVDGVIIYAGNAGKTLGNSFTIDTGDLKISKVSDVTEFYQGQNHIGYLKDNNNYLWTNFNN